MSAVKPALFLYVDWLGENNSKKYPDWVNKVQIVIANTTYNSFIPQIDSPLMALQLDFYEATEEAIKLPIEQIKKIAVKIEHIKTKVLHEETIHITCPFEPEARQHYRLQLKLKEGEVVAKLIQLTPDQMEIYHLVYDELHPRTETFLKNIEAYSTEAMEAFGEALKAEIKKMDAAALNSLVKKLKIKSCLKAIGAKGLENVMRVTLGSETHAKNYSELLLL